MLTEISEDLLTFYLLPLKLHCVIYHVFVSPKHGTNHLYEKSFQLNPQIVRQLFQMLHVILTFSLPGSSAINYVLWVNVYIPCGGSHC